MTPSPKHPAEELYVRAWPERERARERLALSLAESMGRVRPEFARWVRAGRPE